MKNIYIGGWGHGNLGDEAVLMTTIHHFGKDAIAVSPHPDHTQALHNIETTTIDAIPTEIGKVIIGGGGLFYGDSSIHYANLVKHFYTLDIPVVIFNVGVGEISDDIRNSLALCEKITVRNARSAKNLKLPEITETLIWPDQDLPDGNAPEWLDEIKRPLIGVCLKNVENEVVLPKGNIIGLTECIHRHAHFEDDLWGNKDKGINVSLSFTDPRDLKATIGKLDSLYTNRKHAYLWGLGHNVECHYIESKLGGTSTGEIPFKDGW